MLGVKGRSKSACNVVLVEAREKIEGTVGGKRKEVTRESVEERRKREWAEEVLFGEVGNNGGNSKG